MVERLRRRPQPTTWSLSWGTVCAGCFLALLITGVILMIFYDGSGEPVTYGGGYALHGVETGAIIRLPGGGYVELSAPRGDPPPGLAEVAPAATEQRGPV